MFTTVITVCSPPKRSNKLDEGESVRSSSPLSAEDDEVQKKLCGSMSFLPDGLSVDLGELSEALPLEAFEFVRCARPGEDIMDSNKVLALGVEVLVNGEFCEASKRSWVTKVRRVGNGWPVSPNTSLSVRVLPLGLRGNSICGSLPPPRIFRGLAFLKT